MKILFYQRSDVVNSSGGTEKVLCNLSNIFAQKKYQVTLMTNENKKGFPFFPLSKKVNFINIGGTNFKGFKNFIFKLIKSTPLLNKFPNFNNYKYTSDIVYNKIKEINPNIIILANPSDALELCYSHKYDCPIIQMIHNTPKVIFTRRSKNVLKQTLEIMNKIFCCQVLMPSYIDKLKEFYDKKIVYIPNIVPTSNFNTEYEKNKKEYIIINIGRICPVKNQELIIKSFAKIANKYKRWKIYLYGKGSKKYLYKLQKLIKDNNLINRVIFKGLTTEPLKELSKADIFTFPSLYEGFPLALTEAMSVGLPCIGLNEADGVNELIENNKNGILTNNNEFDFSSKLEELIVNFEKRKQLGQQAKEDVKKYNEDFVINEWEKLIKYSVNKYNK